MARPSHPKPISPPPPPETDDSLARLGEGTRRLALGLTATLIAMRPLWPSEDAATGSGLSWVCALIVVLAVGIIGMLLGGAVRFRWSAVDAAFLTLVLLVGLSATGSQDRRAAINLAWEWGGLGLVFVLVRCLPRSRGESAALAGLLTATAVSVAAYGLYQVAVELPLLRQGFLANPEASLRKLGIAPGSTGEVAFRNRLLASKEPFATFALANSLAGFLVGPLALALAVAVDNLRREGRGSRLVAIGLAAIPASALGICLALTKSRSAWLGLFVALIPIAWRARSVLSKRMLAVAGVATAIVLIGGVAGLVRLRQLDREVLTEASKSLKVRLEYWAGAWGVITDAPPPFPPPVATVGLGGVPVEVPRPESRAFWRGLGPGNFAGPYLRHKSPAASEEVLDPHDALLDVWCTAGLPAVVALVATLGLGIWQTTRRQQDGPGPSLDDPAAWLVPFAGAAWVAVVAFGKLDPFAGDLLGRWTVLGLAWAGEVAFGVRLWRRRPIPGAGAGLGVLAIAINLLAAGGIGMPSVALPLWTLLALGLNLRDDLPSGRLRERTHLAWGFAAATTWAAVVGSFAGAIGPFWLSEIALGRAEAALRSRPIPFEVGREEINRAIEADRANVRPFLLLAELEFLYSQSAEAKTRRGAWERVFIPLDMARERPWRDSDSIDIYRLQASYARQILPMLPDPVRPLEILSLRQKLARSARRVAELYPTSALARAELAQASADIGLHSAAVSEAEAALRLDDLMPHADKKLPEALVRDLHSKLSAWKELRDHPPVPPTAK